jgi:hypothetical protein
MSIPDRYRPIVFHEDKLNEKMQRNPQQIMDIQMNSPGNPRLTTITYQSPIHQHSSSMPKGSGNVEKQNTKDLTPL